MVDLAKLSGKATIKKTEGNMVREERSSSSIEYGDIFDLDFLIPSAEERRSKGERDANKNE